MNADMLKNRGTEDRPPPPPPPPLSLSLSLFLFFREGGVCCIGGRLRLTEANTAGLGPITRPI